MAKLPLHPKHPERICWGCDKYCSADDLYCGNGTVRTQHPVEVFGEDWTEWEHGTEKKSTESESLSPLLQETDSGLQQLPTPGPPIRQD